MQQHKKAHNRNKKIAFGDILRALFHCNSQVRFSVVLVLLTITLLLLTAGCRTCKSYVKVTSEPSGAQVLWEGEPAGYTPCVIADITAGKNVYQIALSQKNYLPHSQKVEIPNSPKSKKQVMEVNVKLKPSLVDSSFYDTNLVMLNKTVNHLLQGELLLSLINRNGSVLLNVTQPEEALCSLKTGRTVKNALAEFLTTHNIMVVRENQPEAVIDYFLDCQILASYIFYSQPDLNLDKYPQAIVEVAQKDNIIWVKRNSEVKLHLELANAKTGMIVWAKTLEGSIFDVIPQQFKEILADSYSLMREPEKPLTQP